MAKAKKNVTTEKRREPETENRHGPGSSSGESPAESEKENEAPPNIQFARQASQHEKKYKTVSKKSGVVFPVTSMLKRMKKGHYASNIRKTAAIYMVGAIEYLSAEILELGGNAARDNNRVRINPRHLMLAIKQDEELNNLLKNVTFAQSGVVPNIRKELLPKNSKKRAPAAAVTEPRTTEESPMVEDKI